jgi:hypothetical protein
VARLPRSPVSGLRKGGLHDEAQRDDDGHVDRDVHKMSSTDECGRDQRCGTTEAGDYDLVGEADTRYPNRRREQFGLNRWVHRLPDPEDDPPGRRNHHIDKESWLVQQHEQRVEQHDHADGTDDGEDLAAADPVRERTTDRHDDDEQGESDDASGQGRSKVAPTAVGGGTPFFPTLPSWISLRLLENRTFPGGTVLLRYEAKHD